MIAPALSPEADRAEVRRIVAQAGSSFAAGMRVLPRPRRDAIHAVYAFCRVADDIADGDLPGTSDPRTRAARLDDLQAEVAATEAGHPRTAIGTELARAIGRFDLPTAELHLLIDGMRMDAQAIVAPTAEALSEYVRRVAGTVGLLSMRCFGAWRGAPSERFALNLARGVQLTNILRDVAEDAAMGRLYMPRDVLDAAGMPHDVNAATHPNLPAARAALGKQARAAFDAALAEVPAHPRLPLVPALVMMGPYERLLRIMEGDWTAPPVRLSGRAKLRAGLAQAMRGGR
ncbi:squalene/phytoene synthase family protein [Jannaschia sp. LMIT008]|uniref:squalene/phytoene synthase family protein n=1 Tax=Jannaschia maritima TaxID=3032585 RepID=UPI002811D343|nr:squalene/phytoene synthase family protein [Jannaschia sp. LMIT008]